MRVSLWSLTGALLASIVATTPAQAMWTIKASGVWNSNAPVTPYSAPLESYSLSFNLPTQTFSTIYQDPNISVTTQTLDFHYDLGGVDVPVTPWTGPQSGCFGQAPGTLCNIAFFDVALDGGIAVAFSDHVLELYGADIGSKGVLVRGDYTFIPNMDDTLVNEGTAFSSVVPEPAAWSFILLGVAGVGALARTGRRRSVLAR